MRLKPNTTKPLPRVDKGGTKWETCSDIFFMKYYQLASLRFFYKRDENGNYIKDSQGKIVKQITPEVIAMLPKTAVTIAVLFLDDGSKRKECFSGKIALQGFTLSEQALLCNWLAECGLPGCYSTVHTKKSGQYYICVPAASFGFLVDIIKPVVLNEIPCMAYKLNSERDPRND